MSDPPISDIDFKIKMVLVWTTLKSGTRTGRDFWGRGQDELFYVVLRRVRFTRCYTISRFMSILEYFLTSFSYTVKKNLLKGAYDAGLRYFLV